MEKRKILYSPGYGAGWLSWNDGLSRKAKRFILEDRWLVEKIESGQRNDKTLREFIRRFNDMFPGEYLYTGGFEDLVVCEVEADALVRVEDHDGNESVIISHIDWF